MTDFTFTKPLNANYAETGHIQTRIIVAGSTDSAGQLFSQELELPNEEIEAGSNKANKMQVDEQM